MTELSNPRELNLDELSPTVVDLIYVLLYEAWEKQSAGQPLTREQWQSLLDLHWQLVEVEEALRERGRFGPHMYQVFYDRLELIWNYGVQLSHPEWETLKEVGYHLFALEQMGAVRPTGRHGCS